jgi:peptide deformylase
MSIRKIIQIGHPSLKAKNDAIGDFKSMKLKKLIKDLKDTMNKNDLIGIAAPQIAENYTVFVTHPRNTKSRNLGKADKFRVFINPKIINFSKEESVIYEGCGCVPNIFGPVRRPKEIKIEAFDQKQNKFSLRCDGILARVIQHEYDHLSGIEFIEKICDYKKIMTKEFYIKNIKNSKEQLSASKITKVEFKKVN